MIRSEQQPPIGKAGVLAASGAAGVAFAGWMRLASSAPSWPVVVAIWLAAAAMLIPLCRATMPPQLRAPLVLALLATMLFGAARADPFGVRSMPDPVTAADDQVVPNRVTDKQPRDRAGASRSAGADVAMAAGRGGGADWARDIDAALAGRIGGTAARRFRITGSVDENGAGGAALEVAIDWAIDDGSTTVSCGRTSASGRDRAAIIDALGETMAEALRRSISLGKASCP